MKHLCTSYGSRLPVLSLLLTFIMIGIVSVGWGQSFLGYNVSNQSNFGTSPLNPSTITSNITAGGLTRGAGIKFIGTAPAGAWGGTGWNYSSAAEAIGANAYITF